MHRNLQLIRGTAPACARDIFMEGDRQGADQRSWPPTVRDGDDRHVRQSYSRTRSAPQSTVELQDQLPQRGCDQESEPVMTKHLFGITQNILNAMWRAARRLEGRPAAVAKVKLDGRRGYGDDGIASPDQNRDGK